MQTTLANPSPKLRPLAASLEKNHRILVVDDNEAIHADFRKILGPDAGQEDFAAEEAEVFGRLATLPQRVQFELDFAFQGEEAWRCVQAAVEAARRYAVVFMDVRMPPGWDGLETTQKLWEADPDLQIVICTAYSDYSWEEMMEMIGSPERLLILKKPFDTIEVLQFAHALTEKWSLLQAARGNTVALERVVAERTRELQDTNALLELAVAGHQAAAERVGEQAALLDKAQDAILVRDLGGIIHFWNKSAENLYGWTAEEAIGREVTGLLYAGLAQFTAAQRTVIEKGAWMGELLHLTKGGRELTVEGHWTLVRNPAGAPKSILCINTDITERNLLKAQLIRAQRMESLGTLAGGIAHDLNNTLSPITMAIDLLKHEEEDAARLNILEILETNARRGADMVRQVLSFARGVAGERVALQPKYLIKEVKKIAADTFPKNLELTTDIAAGLWNVLGDSTQLHQVLLNLCVNARDAMPGGGRIAISAANVTLDAPYVAMNREAKPGSYVVIEVRDTGTGMAAPILEKIFDPFFTTKGIGAGTGLGLSTSLGIVKSHDGFIRVQSEVGQGTSFQVHLPAESGSQIPPAESRAPALVRGHGEWVLIIDDEEAVRSVTQHALEAFGYRVLTASEGAEAIALYALRHAEIAVVLTDMMMPVMDGTATIAVLRRINPAVKIITASGLKSDGCPKGKPRGDPVHFLPKPYTAEALLRMLAGVLGENSSPR